MSPGKHTVSETAGTGTWLSIFETVIGGDCAADGTINLERTQKASRASHVSHPAALIHDTKIKPCGRGYAARF